MEHNELSATINPQTACLFFQRLPQEIRDRIYNQLFSTSFMFRKTPISRTNRRKTRVGPAPNDLALLRACRRAKLEIGDLWLRCILFCFETPMAMLDTLSALSVAKRSELRHLRVSGNTLCLSYPVDDFFFRLVSVFKLLPGLRLDQLTVLAGDAHRVSYETLDGLIRDGDGWKTLRCICYSSETLGFGPGPLHDLRHANTGMPNQQPPDWIEPQPQTWQAVLERRDGAAACPSVAVYRAKEPKHHGSNPGSGLVTGDERERHMMMITATRGSGVDYEEKEGSPFIKNDIRRDMPGMTWEQIRQKCVYKAYTHDYDSDDDDDFDDEVKAKKEDVRRDVDELVWTPVYTRPTV